MIEGLSFLSWHNAEYDLVEFGKSLGPNNIGSVFVNCLIFCLIGIFWTLWIILLKSNLSEILTGLYLIEYNNNFK